MNCQEYHDLLQRHLDGPGVPPDDLDRHAHDCPDCAALYAAARRLGDGLRLLAPPEPSAELTDRVVASLLRAGRSPRPLRRRLQFALAAAACLLLVVGVYRTFRHPAPEPTPAPAPAPVASQHPPPPAEPPVQLPEPREVREAVAAGAGELVDETLKGTRELLTSGPSLGGLDLEPPLEPPARSLREAGETVSEGLEPMTNSARRAVGLFLRDLPPMDPDQKPGL